jgi:hypothetical protein
MRRREFIAGLGAAAWPIAAQARLDNPSNVVEADEVVAAARTLDIETTISRG